MTDHGLFDIHCHLIPGVDDGAQDLEETRRLLRMEYEQGVRNIIATPHYRDQMFDTPHPHHPQPVRSGGEMRTGIQSGAC